MKTETLIPKFVEYMPETLEQGILYISDEFNTAIHLCACGCGEETVTPFNYVDNSHWMLTKDNNAITLSPSIGNQNMPCKSHYYIKNNKVEWC